MQAFIKIEGVDRTSLINWESFSYEQNKDHKGDLLAFSIDNYGSKNYAPDVLDEVELLIGDTYETAEKKFGGNIITIDEEATGGGILHYEITVKDYSFKMDSKLVVREYNNQTVAQIITDINNTVLPSGYSIDGLVAPVPVSFIKFNYEYPSKCFDQLAELFGYTWWIDETKKINFVPKSSLTAPFNLTDNNDTYIFESLRISRRADQLRNSVFIRGDQFLSSSVQTEILSKQADGNNKIFKLAYQYKNYVLKVNGVTKTVGIENVDNPNDFDALYNFEEKVIKFKTAPLATDTITFEGNFYIPLRIKWRDNASITKYGGEFEFLIIDTSIKNDTGAKDRAKAEILAYSNQMNEASFLTYKDGLQTGQIINIQSDIRGLNETFVISRVTAKCRSGQELMYEIQLTSSRTMDMIDLLQKILLAKNKEISITNDEQLIQIEGFVETVHWVEVWNAQTRPSASPTFSEIIHFSDSWINNPWGINVAPTWVAGPYYPINSSDKNRCPNANTSAICS